MERIFRIDVCDYNNNVLCNLYDNDCKVSGNAVNVYKVDERNGWKELNFSIPSTCITDEGVEENFRLQYLKADYKLRTIDDRETDYYLISEPKINHNQSSKTVDVTAGHVSQNLKNKSIDLEFSDTEGNNVGTADALLETILEGTGWTKGIVGTLKPDGTIAPFMEEDGKTIKKRTMSASAGTGALSMIQQLCELFEAKPVYHGAELVVDIIPMNPFSDVNPGEIPEEVLNGRQVLELSYDRNIKNITKTTNTDTLITRLYAYGSYGDENGTCNISTCSHDEYTFIAPNAEAGEWFEFFDDNEASYYFSPTENLTNEQKLVWSRLDYASRSYIWNETTEKAYKVYKQPQSVYTTLVGTKETVINRFPYLMNFDYYDEVGLFTEEMRQEVAKFQREIPELYEASQNATSEMIQTEMELSETAESNSGFAKLAVQGINQVEDGIKLTFDTSIYPDGVIYRSDYDSAEKSYFQWHVAKKFNSKNEPIDNIGSVIFVVHDTDPVTWDRAYITAIYDSHGNIYIDGDTPKKYDYGQEDDYPSGVRIHATKWSYSPSDRAYLFCTNSMSGMLGAKQAQSEAVLESIETETTEVTEKHPVVFGLNTDPQPELGSAATSYGWYYKYFIEQTEGQLYFCWGARNDNQWYCVYAQETAPQVVNNAYYFDTKTKVLYHGVSGQWSKYESAAEQRLANTFTKVFYYCKRWDMLNKGIYENYYYNTSSLDIGNYAIKNEYAFYWVFTTDQTVTGQLRLDTTEGYVYQDGTVDHIVTASVYPFDTVIYPAENDLSSFSDGTINTENGTEEDSTNIQRSNYIKVFESTLYEYNLPSNSRIFFYDVNHHYISYQSVGGHGTVTMPTRSILIDGETKEASTRYVRIVCSNSISSSHYFRVNGYSTKIYLNEKMYEVLNNITHDDNLLGINTLTKKFADLADYAYEDQYKKLVKAQQDIKDANLELTTTLGEILKENKWQDSKYVEGDEERLYTDAMDNLKELASPEISYSFTFLDTYGSNHTMEYYEEDDHQIEWPDILITDAVHLIDQEIESNCWAYIDKVNKCYDQPWLTSIEINTKLSLVGQHDFTDVLSRIAEVAKDIKSKQNVYDRAARLTEEGYVPGAILEGTIALNQVYLNGGSSNYHTDNNGNIIFESADGLSAMILGGRGLGVSNGKDIDGNWTYRSALTGSGLTADVITTGYMSADRIEAGSITTNKLSSEVGQELEIGSNKSLLLFATVNGSRPSGSVLTKSDSMIQIGTGNTSTSGSGYINVLSGGNIRIDAGGDLDLVGGNITIKANGSGTAGNLLVESSGVFTLKAQGANSIDSTADGVYIGSDGINLGGGKFKFKKSGSASDFKVQSQSIFFGDLTYKDAQQNTHYYPVESIVSGAALKIDSINGSIKMEAANTIDIIAGATINISSGKELSLTTLGTVKIGNGQKPFTIGAVKDTRAYMYCGPSSIGANTDGAYYGTDGIWIRGTKQSKISSIKATAAGDVEVTGTISGSTITGGTINIASGVFKVDADGKLTATSASITGAINSGSTITGAKITGGSIDIQSGKFKVDENGNITATSGTIGGWTIKDNTMQAKSGTMHVQIDASDIEYPLSGLDDSASWIDKVQYAFWAGADLPQDAPFSVTKDGVVTITALRIKTKSNTYKPISLQDWTTYSDHEDEDEDDFTQNMGKLNYQTVKNIDINKTTGKVTINITNGSAGNTLKKSFNSAASVFVKGSWDGATYTASPKMLNDKGQEIDAGGASESFSITGQWKTSGEPGVTNKNLFYVYGGSHHAISSRAVTFSSSVNSNNKKYDIDVKSGTEIIYSGSTGTQVYGNGWTSAYNDVSLPGVNTTSSYDDTMTVITPSSTVDGTAVETEYELSLDNDYAYIKLTDNAKTVARITNSTYSDGYSEGYEDGLDDGWDGGWQEGYAEGYDEGVAAGGSIFDAWLEIDGEVATDREISKETTVTLKANIVEDGTHIDNVTLDSVTLTPKGGGGGDKRTISEVCTLITDVNHKITVKFKYSDNSKDSMKTTVLSQTQWDAY